jgi:hypothetical protein
MSKFEKLIERAKRIKAIESNLVVCDNCSTPADGELSLQVGWTGCGPCITGEAESLDPDRFVHVPTAAAK